MSFAGQTVAITGACIERGQEQNSSGSCCLVM